MSLQSDFKDLLAEFAAAEVEYLVVGGYAVAFHGEPRFTKDLDLWLADRDDNLARARAALVRFGAPDEVLAALATAAPEDVVWMGHPPARVDLLKGVPGGDFDRAWANRVDARWDGVPVSVVSRSDLIALKRASGRPMDLADAEALLRALP